MKSSSANTLQYTVELLEATEKGDHSSSYIFSQLRNKQPSGGGRGEGGNQKTIPVHALGKMKKIYMYLKRYIGKKRQKI